MVRDMRARKTGYDQLHDNISLIVIRHPLYKWKYNILKKTRKTFHNLCYNTNKENSTKKMI